MRRRVAAISVALLAMALALSATASNPNRETISLNARDQSAARAVVPKKADLVDGHVWHGGLTKPDLSPNPTCPNYHPDLSRFVVTGAAASDWKSGLSEIETQTELLQTAERVRKEWHIQIQAPGALSCLQSITKREFSTAGIRLISFTRIPFPHVATYVIAFRVVAAASKVKFIVEVALFGRGRYEASLTLSGLSGTRAEVSSESVRLARLVAGRMRS